MHEIFFLIFPVHMYHGTLCYSQVKMYFLLFMHRFELHYIQLFQIEEDPLQFPKSGVKHRMTDFAHALTSRSN